MKINTDFEARLKTLEALGGDMTVKYNTIFEVDLAILEATKGGGGGGGTGSAGSVIVTNLNDVTSPKEGLIANVADSVMSKPCQIFDYIFTVPSGTGSQWEELLQIHTEDGEVSLNNNYGGCIVRNDTYTEIGNAVNTIYHFQMNNNLIFDTFDAGDGYTGVRFYITGEYTVTEGDRYADFGYKTDAFDGTIDVKSLGTGQWMYHDGDWYPYHVFIDYCSQEERVKIYNQLSGTPLVNVGVLWRHNDSVLNSSSYKQEQGRIIFWSIRMDNPLVTPTVSTEYLLIDENGNVEKNRVRMQKA